MDRRTAAHARFCKLCTMRAYLAKAFAVLLLPVPAWQIGIHKQPFNLIAAQQSRDQVVQTDNRHLSKVSSQA